jgi:hypothetical protein
MIICFLQKLEDEDRFSMMPDDILLSILGRVDIITLWGQVSYQRDGGIRHGCSRNSPSMWKLFYLSHAHTPIEVEHMDAAMAPLAKVVRSFLETNWNKAPIKNSNLKLVWNCFTLSTLAQLYKSLVKHLKLHQLSFIKKNMNFTLFMK